MDYADLFLGLSVGMYFAIIVIRYIIGVLCYPRIAKKAGLKDTWYAYVPILQFVILLHCINKRGWNILLTIIPIVNGILLIIWQYRFFKNFGASTGLAIASILIAPVGIILWFIIAFDSEHKYVGQNNFTAACIAA